MVTKRLPDSSTDHVEFWAYSGQNMDASTNVFHVSSNYPVDVSDFPTDFLIHQTGIELGNWLSKIASELSSLTERSIYVSFDDEQLELWVPLAERNLKLARRVLERFALLRTAFDNSDSYEIDCHVLHGGDAAVPTGTTELDAA